MTAGTVRAGATIATQAVAGVANATEILAKIMSAQEARVAVYVA